MHENLIQTRIIPPGFTGGIVHRKRLLSILNENIDKSLILICSSAGFGKTTLVQDFINNSKCSCAWYYISPDIVSFYSFFIYIINSLKRLSKDFGENSLRLINAIRKDTEAYQDLQQELPDYQDIINDITATFLNEFCLCFKDNVILVLDDLHNIDTKKHGKWLNYLLDRIFDDLPQNLHIVITSRETPEFNLSRLNAKRRVFRLGTRELVFNGEEITELLEQVYNIEYSHDDIEILRSKISGWITGIHLILQAYGKDFRNVKVGDLLNYEDIFSYFASGIFEGLDDRMKKFLLGTALLQDFDHQTCNHLLKIDDSEKIISELLKKNIFIQRNTKLTSAPESGTAYTYNYQELFKLYLLSKLYELRSREEIKIQFKELFDYYLMRDEIIASVNYGLQAEVYADAITLIKQNFDTLFEKGNFEILWKWISSIPDEIVNSDSNLLYFRGRLHLYLHSDPVRSLECLNAALSLTEKDKDVSLIVNCWILKRVALEETGKFEGLIDELNNLLTLNISPVERAKILYAISMVSYRFGFSYNEIIEILTEALNICNEQNLLSLKTDIFGLLGSIYSDWGDMVKSIQFSEQTLNIDTDILKIFSAMNGIIDNYCTIGNYSRAKVYLDKALEMYKSYPFLLFKRTLLQSKGLFHFECGDFEECVKIYREIIKLEIKNNIKYYAPNRYVLIGESYYYLKNYDAALKNFENARSYLAQNDEFGHILILHLKTKITTKLKIKDDDEKILLNALEYYKKHNLLRLIAEIEFNLADYYLRSGMEKSAFKYLEDCLKVSSEKQYVSPLVHEVLNSRSVFDFSISHPELSEYKNFIQILFENVRKKLEFDWFSEKCRKRLTRQIKELDDIRMTSFGRLEFKLRGKQIPESKWTRKKSKFILAYLLAEPNRVLTKDKIVDDFLQDIPPEKVDAVYHRTLSDMRTALKVEYDFQIKSGKKGGKSKASKDWSPSLLLYEGGTLHLNSDFYYWSDCAEFEKLYNSAMSSGVDTDKKIKYCTQAIELYKGDFLPGYYDSWCEEMRQNYTNMFINICSELIKTLKEKELFLEIIKYTEKILKTDKLNHEAYVEMIEAYTRLGKINMAKDKLSLMLKVYDEELGEKPEKSVLDTINQILT